MDANRNDLALHIQKAKESLDDAVYHANAACREWNSIYREGSRFQHPVFGMVVTEGPAMVFGGTFCASVYVTPRSGPSPTPLSELVPIEGD